MIKSNYNMKLKKQKMKLNQNKWIVQKVKQEIKVK